MGKNKLSAAVINGTHGRDVKGRGAIAVRAVARDHGEIAAVERHVLFVNNRKRHLSTVPALDSEFLGGQIVRIIEGSGGLQASIARGSAGCIHAQIGRRT